MPKVTDIKAYWREIAQKAGLDEESFKQVSGVIDNDKFAKAFTDNFKPLPDYSADLDQVRDKAKADKDAEYAEWHQKEMAKYNEFVKGIDELNWYRQNYGGQRQDPKPGESQTMTQADIDKLVDAKLNTVLNDTLTRRDAAVLDLLEVREFHMDKFKSPLNVKAFESAWKEHPEWGGSLKQAYKSFVEPDVQKAETAEWEAKIKQAREEGIRDGFSRKQLPTDHQSNQFSPFFDRKEDVAKMTEREQESHSRESFFAGLREGK